MILYGSVHMAVGPGNAQPFFLNKIRNHPHLMTIGNQTIRVAMGIMLFLMPFNLLTTVEEICFYLSIFIILVLSLFLKKKCFSFESPLSFPFLIFLSWTCFDFFFALNKGNSLHDIFAHLIKYLAVYYILINFFSSRKLLLRLSWIFVISAALFSFGAFGYFYLYLGNKLSTLFRVHNYIYGYFHFWVVFASLLSIQMIFEDIKWQKRLFWLFCLSGMILIIILSQTRSALIALAAGLVIYFLKNKKVLFFLLILAAISVFSISSMSNRLSLSTIYEHANIRIGITYLFFEMMKDYPITGVGYGMQTYDDSDILAKYNERVPPKFRQEPPVRSPHNLFTDVTIRLGIVGLVSFIFILFRFVQTGWKLMKYGADDFIRKWSLCLMGAFVAFLVNAMAMDATFGVQAVVFYTLMAMITILWRSNSMREISTPAEAKTD